MKRTMLKLYMAIVAFLLSFPLTKQSAEVTLQTAEQVARTFLALHHDKGVAELNVPMHRLDTRWDAFYVSFLPTVWQLSA